MHTENIAEGIIRLKKERDAVILAHYYQIPDIQNIADHVGDSFALSKLAAELPQKVIVFCGVDFMAESAKLLSPDKTVLLPVKHAGCPMADMATDADVRNMKAQHPDAAVVSYVNSSTAVKAVSDICCTSSNAIRVIRSLPHEKIIFVPDKNLGGYAAEQVPEKTFILHDGYCPPHEDVMAIDAKLAREQHPDAQLLVHPECRKEVRDQADFIGSTAQIIKYAGESDHNEFIIGTEQGILPPLRTANPDKTFHMLTGHFICPNMKKTTLQHLYESLQENRHVIEIDRKMAERARKPLERMLKC